MDGFPGAGIELFFCFFAGSAFDFSNVLRQESYLGFIMAPNTVQRVSDKEFSWVFLFNTRNKCYNNNVYLFFVFFIERHIFVYVCYFVLKWGIRRWLILICTKVCDTLGGSRVFPPYLSPFRLLLTCYISHVACNARQHCSTCLHVLRSTSMLTNLFIFFWWESNVRINRKTHLTCETLEE